MTGAQRSRARPPAGPTDARVDPSGRAASTRAAATQAKLIAAGERLFARHGVSAVSLREINTAAGQRNTSALHYHFGSREGLLRAILAPHLERLRERRAAMMVECRDATGALDLHGAAEVLVRPHAEFLAGSESERAFVCIARQLTIDPELEIADVTDLLDEASISDALGVIRATLAPLPDEVVGARVGMAMMMLVHAIADRASAAPGRSQLSDDDFTAMLLDMFVGALVGPGRS